MSVLRLQFHFDDNGQKYTASTEADATELPRWLAEQDMHRLYLESRSSTFVFLSCSSPSFVAQQIS